MKEDIANIAKQTLLNLDRQNKFATPREYAKEFCKIANEISFTINDCELFRQSFSKLSDEEKKNKKVETVYDIVEILLNRIDKKELDKISGILQKSLKPSIAVKINDDFDNFSVKIGNSPSLIFKEPVQKQLESYIEQRFEADKKIVEKKTSDIARIITLISRYLNDAIDVNHKGSLNVSKIGDEIKSIDIENSTKKELDILQTKLVNAARTIENEMLSVNGNLNSSKEKVNELENRIKELEEKLEQSKKENLKDHLTGAMNRKFYEIELKKLDEKYIRVGQDFAIVFFDIDHFKKVNDNYGHDGGDVILKTFAQLLMKLTREIDIVGRFGGEEFIVALHYKNPDELEKYVTRIKNVVNKNKFIFQKHKIHITFSAGVELRSNTETLQETISNADKYLYKAKREGRNKIIFWDGKEY